MNAPEINVTTATTAELVAFFNTFAVSFGQGQPVKKFSDRAAAEKRVTKLLAAMKPTPAQTEEMEKFLDANSPAPETTPTPDGGVFDPAQNDGFVECEPEIFDGGVAPALPVDVKRSEGVKASWLDPEVRAARAIRHHVSVDGQVFNSVRAAFKALGLPDAKHIPFRLDLKAQGEGVFEGHDFKLVEIVAPAPKPGKRELAKARKEAAAQA